MSLFYLYVTGFIQNYEYFHELRNKLVPFQEGMGQFSSEGQVWLETVVISFLSKKILLLIPSPC